MEELNIYGHLGSQPTRSVVAFLKLSDIPFKFNEINLLKGEQLTESFIKINPFKAIPALSHGDYTLWESAAMVTYISEAFNSDNQWYPKDLHQRARINSYLHWHQDNTRELIASYVREKYVYPTYFGFPAITPEREVVVKANFENCLTTLTWMLKETGFIARTSQASIADVFAYSEIAQSWLLKYDLTPYPEVNQWFETVGKIEVVSEVHEPLRAIANSI